MSALREALGNLPEAVFADLLESDEAYRVVLDLPGVTADTVDVTAEGGRLRIEARRDKDVPTAFRYVTEERSLFLDTELPLPPTVHNARNATIQVEIRDDVVRSVSIVCDADRGADDEPVQVRVSYAVTGIGEPEPTQPDWAQRGG